MNADKLIISQFGNRLICIGGVGTLYHESGFPLGMAAKLLQKRGVELSWFHVIKELWFQYTTTERLYSKIVSEVEDASVEGIKVDIDELKEFCCSDMDEQREMIFQYLYGFSSYSAMSNGELREQLSKL